MTEITESRTIEVEIKTLKREPQMIEVEIKNINWPSGSVIERHKQRGND